MAQLLFNKEAPQVWEPLSCRDNCQGQELGLAVWPPTIRAPAGRWPQVAGKEMK